MNRITINFTPCSPAIGYHVFYREVGDVSFIEWPDIFTTSPIVFEVDGLTDQLYEGYIVAECEGDILSPQVPFETVLCSELGDGCCDPEIINAEAETIIPDGSGSGSSSVGGDFLRLVYNVDMSGESLSDWNTFFDTATWASTPFTSVEYSAGGTVVDLFGMTGMEIPTATFNNNLTIIKVLDFANEITRVQGAAFGGCENLNEVDLPACVDVEAAGFFVCPALVDVNLPLVTVLTAQVFAGCTLLNESGLITGDITSIGADAFNAAGFTIIDFPFCTSAGLGACRFLLNLTTVNLLACTSIGAEFFRQNPAMNFINLRVCTDFGGTTANDNCFQDVTGSTFTLIIPTATATDGDIITAQANNSVTLILV